jgi:hypothetical protein
VSALADVDPPGSFRPRCRLVMELCDEPGAIELVARGKAEDMQNLARDVNRALGVTPADEIPTAAAAATEDEYWISKGVLRRQAAERWLAGAPTDLPGGTIESPEPALDGGPPVLSYQPDPKDMVIEERWPGRLRLYVPAASGTAVLRDPMTIALGFFLALLFLKFVVSPALRAAYFPLPLPPTAFLLIVTAVLTVNTARKLGRSIIEVDVDELTLTYRWLLGIGWNKRWAADSIADVSAEAENTLAIRQRPDTKRPITLARFASFAEARKSALQLRHALGLEANGRKI